MGLDLLDIGFRIEREFGVRLDFRELIFQDVTAGLNDPTMDELFNLLLARLPEPRELDSSLADAAVWDRLQTIVADVLAVPPEKVTRTARLRQDLGCE